MQEREICYEIDLTAGLIGIELEALKQVFNAVERQLPEHGNVKIIISGVRINPNQLNNTHAISEP